MSIQEIEISDQMFSLSQSNICRLCGLSNSSRFLIYKKVDAAELTIADLINRYLPIQVCDDDEYPKTICANCKCQLDMLVKFIDDLLDGQMFLKNVYEMYKSKQLSSAEYIPLVDERTNNFKNNINTKSNDVEFICETCGLTLDNKNELKVHLKNHHEEEQRSSDTATVKVVERFSCEYCKKTFAHKSGLNTHLKTHKGDKKYVCKVCKKSYYQNGNLQEHMRIHTGEKPFNCEYCTVSFRTSSQLKTHIRCHSGAKPYKCSVCERSFPHNNTLKIHLRRHYNDRQYNCEYCPKKFVDRTALVRHSRTHTGEKPYYCDLCNKDFATVTNFNKHRKIHMKDKHSTVWELTTKFQKGSSEIDYINATIINDNELQACDRTEDLFLISNQVKDLNTDIPSNSVNNLDDLLNVNTSFTSLNSISFNESMLELAENIVS
ncbi:zinc finger protein 658B-like [Melanaphis sacchari]|uniref:Zinc finger protein 177 n=1 Tax=Melanaphis sacchari TaxID=742174 RepID=A0A2H8TLB1_9HEMI|nr:zinc finger protein 658B-like [Melanaphis sacchari]